MKNWTNEKLGNLVFKEKTSKKSKSNGYLWRAECLLCGNTDYMAEPHIIEHKIKRRKGYVPSCGCNKINTCYSAEHLRGMNGRYISKLEETFVDAEIIPRRIYWTLKSKAKYRDLKWELTPQYLASLYTQQGGLCALSGLPIEFKDIGSRLDLEQNKYMASLDRIDSSEGYIEGNVHWVSFMVNNMKQNYTLEEFLNMCKLIKGVEP